jgi:hypothetical protein
VYNLIKLRRVYCDTYFAVPFRQLKDVWPCFWHDSQACFLLHYVLLHSRSELKLLHITNLSFGSFLDAAVVAAVISVGCIAFFCLRDVQYISQRICGISYTTPIITLL